MGKLWNVIKPAATKFITAMLQKQVENTVTKIGQELNEELFGTAVVIHNTPFSNNIKKEFPNIEKLPHHRALNEVQRKRLEKKEERKKKRLEEVKEKKNIIIAAGDATINAAKEQLGVLKENAMTLAVNIADQAISQVAGAATMLVDIFESYKRLFTEGIFCTSETRC